MTTQQLTGILQPSSSSIIASTMLNGNNRTTVDHRLTSDTTSTSDAGLSLSLAQLAQKASQRHRRSSRYFIDMVLALFVDLLFRLCLVRVHRRRNVDGRGVCFKHSFILNSIFQQYHRFRLYERDPFTNKPMKSNAMSDTSNTNVSNLRTSAVVLPGSTGTFQNVPSSTHSFNSIVFPSQTVR
jgi:hypothetical protein